MGLTLFKPWYRLRIDGEVQELTAPPTMTEQLEAWTTVVLQAELAAQPELNPLLPVDVYEFNLGEASSLPMFSGSLNQVMGTSLQNRAKLLFQGPLHRLRRSTTAGRNLTGSTDGEAVKEILDACNVSYADADIQDASYVLGDLVDILWQKDQPAWQVIQELDRVFGMATLEVGDGRVVRFAYDKVPDLAMAVRTYEKGVNANWQSLDRDQWNRDLIQNRVVVTGATWQDAKNCSLTIWAKASSANAAFESTSVRVASLPFQSDIIQDQALAEAVATRLMHWYNRQPDQLVIEAQNDLQLHPGNVVSILDPSWAIGITEAKPYLILTIDRFGHRMRMTCVGGAAGFVGVLESGVEKRCNKNVAMASVPGDFEIPPIGEPPWIPIGGYDCFLDGGPGGVCPVEPPDGSAEGCTSASFSAGQAFTSFTDWRLAGRCQITAAIDQLTIGVDTAQGDLKITLAGTSVYGALLQTPKLFEVTAPGGFYAEEGNLHPGSTVDYVLQWFTATKTLHWWVEVNDERTYGGSIVCDDLLTSVETEVSTAGSPTRTSEVMTYDCGTGGTLVPITWTVEEGNWDTGPGADADNLVTHGPDYDFFGGVIYSGDTPVDGAGWTMSGELTLGDRCTVDLWIEEPTDFTGWSLTLYTPIPHVDPDSDPCLHAALRIESLEETGNSGDVFCWQPDVPITFEATRDATAETFAVTVTQGAETRTVSVASTTAPVDNWRVAVYVSQDVELPSTSLSGLLLRDFVLEVTP